MAPEIGTTTSRDTFLIEYQGQSTKYRHGAKNHIFKDVCGY